MICKVIGNEMYKTLDVSSIVRVCDMIDYFITYQKFCEYSSGVYLHRYFLNLKRNDI